MPFALVPLLIAVSADASLIGGRFSTDPGSTVAARKRALPGKLDRDGDGLRNRFERRRSHTSPRSRDTDRDGFSDGYEVHVLHTNPRDPSSPGLPPAQSSPPPAAGGSTGSPPAIPAPPASQPQQPSGEAPMGEPPEEEEPLVEEPPTEEPPAEEPPVEEPPAEEPPIEEPAPRVDGEVSTASALLATAKSAASDGKTFYLRGGSYGSIDLSNVRRGSLVTFVAYPGEQPSFGSLAFAHSQNLRFDGFRASTVDIGVGSAASPNRDLQFANCTLGGSEADRINPLAVVGVFGYTEDVLIDHCSIGWTDMAGQEDHGNGVRAVNGDVGQISRLTIRNSRIHHVSCDAIQVAGNSEFTLDRTEIAYVAPEPGYGCHADSLQNLGFIGDGAKITNNYIHHIGYYSETYKPSAGDPAGQFIYHNNGGGALIENNLFVDSRNYALNLGSGCGGCPPSLRNVILRRNTIVRDGTAFGGESTPDMRWAPTSGSGNRFEANVIGGIAADGSLSSGVVSFSGNVYTDQSPIGPGDVGPVKLTFNASMNCTTAACAAAGYRKPSGVPW